MRCISAAEYVGSLSRSLINFASLRDRAMAYQEYVQKAIATGKAYDELPAKVKGAVPLQEWKTR